jgi:hypothetical protein
VDQHGFPFRPRDNRMVGFEHSSRGGNDEFDGAVLLLPALNQVALPSRFADRLVDAVKLQELSVILANLLFHMPVPSVAGEGERSVLLFIHGDVIRAFEPDDIIAFDVVFVVTTGGRFLEQGQAHFLNGRAQSVDVFDLSFDGCEVTHLFVGGR